jgi:excisionase family DNA binding protein
MASQDFMTPPQLAERLGLPEGTLAQWRYHRKGPAFHKIGRHVRYSVSDIECWEATQRTACGAA